MLLGLVPGFNGQEVADGVLHGELKRLELTLPVGPLISIEKSNFPETVGRSNQLGIHQRSHLTLQFHHWVKGLLLHITFNHV